MTITKCEGEGCPRKKICLRYTAPEGHLQKYTKFDPVDCKHFIGTFEDRPNEPGLYSLKYYVQDEKFAQGKGAYTTSIYAASWADAQRQADELGMELEGQIISSTPADPFGPEDDSQQWWKNPGGQ